MKKFALSLACAAALMASASPAAAGWKFTTWGMTVEQTLAAGQGQLVRSDDAKCEVRSAKAVEISGVTFSKVALCFEAGGLARVEMTTDAAYQQVEATLVGAMGSPALREDRSVRFAVFNDAKSDNTLRLVDADLFRVLIYARKPSGF